ncbi:MAG: cell division protein FtsZ [Hyphomonas sp.]|jgi:cell division protein FtsZ|uniref:Cell division protein FtsZ n=2 Tax=root TaxID=1 RepID=A0A160TZT6_9ZZZZ|nr:MULTISPECIES: cell division protein FtsZ [unclassified Hyphomonas]MAN89896.1 cell division protein FtsZ [Hyphomonadaceae bacterium]MAA83551.1 cell division protein FtsZ [Hyphomonas sp.]MBO6581453.1 cell division protein FtsZ [Hyphomonas sp.]MDF1807386.1 cell division protein FtsZ [Hyphomonas sp.]QSR23645.1 cell division protein FtsZ [Hyphomonas sp. KY3]|tara:strand:- start:4122 stop:5576 length:1455 start_codon:yes stop_codon:yes gene_type:complete
MTHELKPRILVFGVGGAGGNAVDNMIEANLQGVEFIVANTDAQALSRSKTENRIQLGPETTSGLGAGARPDIGAKAAEESMDEIRERLEGAHMVFIAAGMGGGTGTGAAPVIARAAQEMNILTVAVVTKPFSFEGTRRMTFAEEGLAGIQKYVDTMIVVPNQNLFRIANDRTTFAEAFRMADDVLYSGVRGITDLMVMPGLINLDFADVSSIMRGMGAAMMGMGEAEGENRALEAAKLAIDNPLLDDISMRGAKGVLINITGGYDMTLFELDEAANEVRREVDPDANIILGSAFDTELEGKIRVSVVAAGVDAVMPSLKQDAPVAETVRQPIAEPIEEEHVEPVAEVESETEVEVAAEEDDRPKVILHHASPLRSGDVDPRDDFTGQSLPAEHFEGSEGEDQIQADAVFSKQTEAPAEEDGRPSPSGFSNLFGWRRGAQGENDHAPSAESGSQIVSSPDDHPEPAPFDDADLEIPAFLRRSANH